jgi:hypothetical protein
VGCLVIDESSVSYHVQEDRELRKGSMNVSYTSIEDIQVSCDVLNS